MTSLIADLSGRVHRAPKTHRFVGFVALSFFLCLLFDWRDQHYYSLFTMICRVIILRRLGKRPAGNAPTTQCGLVVSVRGVARRDG